MTEQTNFDVEKKPLVDEKEEHLKDLAEWTRGNVSWLDEIYNVTALIPNLRTLQVSEFEGTLLPVAKDKPIAKMTLKLLTTNTDDPIDTFINALAEDTGHVPNAKAPSHEPPKESGFSREFTEEINVVKQHPGKFDHYLPEAPVLQATRGNRTRPSLTKAIPAYRPNGGNSSALAIPQKGTMVKYVTPPVPELGPKTPAMAATPVQPGPVQGTAVPGNYSEQAQVPFPDGAGNPAKQNPITPVEAARTRAAKIREARGVPVAAPPADKGKKQ
jgi:hypothetical protein